MRKIIFTKKDLDKKLISKTIGGKIATDFIDVIQIEIIKFPSFDLKNKSLIFTSIPAVQAFFENGFSINDDFTKKKFNKIYAVGKRTKKYLQQKGFGTFKVKKNANELSSFIIKNSEKETFLHFCGNITLENLGKNLKKEEIGYEKIVLYHTILKYPEIQKTYDEVVFFSPSGVRSFVKNNTIDGKKIFSIGKTTSEEIKKYTKEEIFTSEESTLEDLLQLINKKL
jgi:uroporphyrinogen-III synthase